MLALNNLFKKNKNTQIFTNILSPPTHIYINNYKNKFIYKNYLFKEFTGCDDYKNIQLYLVYNTSKNNTIISLQNYSNQVSFNFNLDWPQRELNEMLGLTTLKINDNRNLLLNYSYKKHPLLKSFFINHRETLFYNSSTLNLKSDKKKNFFL